MKQWQPNHATAKRGLTGNGVQALDDQRPWLALCHNAGLTVAYTLDDVPGIVDWLLTGFVRADFGMGRTNKD